MTLREMIEAEGGLINAGQLARNWGYSRQHVSANLTRRPDFPRPVAVLGGREVWTVKETNEWRRKYAEGEL